MKQKVNVPFLATSDFLSLTFKLHALSAGYFIRSGYCFQRPCNLPCKVFLFLSCPPRKTLPGTSLGSPRLPHTSRTPSRVRFFLRQPLRGISLHTYPSRIYPSVRHKIRNSSNRPFRNLLSPSRLPYPSKHKKKPAAFPGRRLKSTVERSTITGNPDSQGSG